MRTVPRESVENEWVTLPGGELEGRRPTALCGPCRVRKAAGAAPRAICFECYRAGRNRDAAVNAAAEVECASEARFTDGLPFELVNIPRLQRLKAERASLRRQSHVGSGQYADRRRHAQIAARHALQRIASGLASRHHRDDLDAIHAAELQLPDAWLPFVVSR